MKQLSYEKEESQEQLDKLASILKRMRDDEKFYQLVHTMSKLPDDQREAFSKIITALADAGKQST